MITLFEVKSSHIDEYKLLDDSVSSGPLRTEDAKMDLGDANDLMLGFWATWKR